MFMRSPVHTPVYNRTSEQQMPVYYTPPQYYNRGLDYQTQYIAPQQVK